MMIVKNEKIRDKVLETKSFQDIAEKLIKFLEANKDYRLSVVSPIQKHLHLINIKTFDRYYFKPTDTETLYFNCANYNLLRCKHTIIIHPS